MEKLKGDKKEDMKCWEFFKCEETTCPVFKSKDPRCWLFSGTHCRGEIQGKFLEKMEMCLDCPPFEANIDNVSLRDTLDIVNRQFKEYKKIVDESDKEIRDISEELALGISEVFEALRKISSGENNIKLNEESTIEIISKLKSLVNLTARDIRESERTMRFTQFALDHTADAAFWTTPDSRFIYVNEAACQSLGYSRKELLSMNVHDIDPKFPKKAWAEHWQNLRKRKSFTFESHHKAKDGRVFPVEVMVNFLKFEGNEYNCAFARDISKRKEIENALEKSEQTFRAISSAAVNAIIVMDNYGKVSYWNPAAERIFGYTSEEAIGKELHLLIAPRKYRDAYKRGFGSFKHTGKGLAVGVTSEFKALRKDGTEFPIEVSTSSVRIGGKWHAVGIIRDITERKRAEEELKRSHEILRALSTHITDIVEAERLKLSRELHDQVGQKLTALNINLEYLIKQCSNGSMNMVSRLNDSKGLVKEIMKLVRNVMADLRPRILDDYGLKAAIHWYSDQFSKSINIPIVFKGDELKPRLPLDVATNLFRIVQESLINIAKYAHAKKVTITLKEIEGMIKLIIIDDGVGFDPIIISQPKKRRGLGLISMIERAEALGGKLHVKSSPGKGTQIIVEIKR
jgi:PAS domain S-box-containing protein